ncbi:down syndrome cell adhesion molecule-like protein 1 [Limosa lapponica baueri]|uniref:Down syndrome cell adhesion molecule-like protein 1 n=1 Tax=Limosa lapponica baueri TaxID=1758121 RepID=A0A2I0T7H3_LIMLA|nr:down syndrome cell adhesion molecule-like protein 1 [Limosa lapponica baueri]
MHHCTMKVWGFCTTGQGFVLQYSVDNSEEWKDVFISSSERSFKLESLKCGTWYKVKLAAKNSVGAGRISEIIEAKTHGREPSFSKDQHLFTHINSTHARLNLQGWSSGGCPITAIVLEYRPKGNWVWQSLRTNSSSEVFLTELREATCKNNRSFDTPVKGPPQGPRLHIDIPRVQLLIEDKEGIKQLGDDKATIPVTDTEFSQAVNPQSFCTGVSLHHPALIQNTGPLIDMSDIRPGTSK